MKRKAIQLAHQTIVVSLPAKWVRQQGIKKGDEIDVKERGKELILESKGNHKEDIEKIEIDITNLNDRIIRYLLSILQKKGYDEIIVKYNKPLATKTIEELTKNLFTGFAIVEQTENKNVLKSISKDLESEFNTALRRAFLVTLSMGKSCLEFIEKEKLKDLGGLITLENTNNQLTNFCERILNKKGHFEYKKMCFMYVIVWNLEKVCDEYKYICEYFSDSKNNKTKINHDVLNLFEETNNFLESYYNLFYKFDINKLNELHEEKSKIENKTKLLYKTKTDREIVLINYLLSVVTRTFDFTGSMIALNL